MKTALQIEEASMVVLAYVLSLSIGYAWWVFVVLLLVPDISMLGYSIDTKTGAFIYNLFHMKAVAIVVGLTGFILSAPVVMLIGLVLFGHTSLDRVFGYGLKHKDNFKNTHLGWIGEGRKTHS